MAAPLQPGCGFQVERVQTEPSSLMRVSLPFLLFLVASSFVFAGRAMAHPPTGIVVDRNGVVYFSDLETIWRVNPQGQLAVFRPGVRGRHVHELSIDEQDNIYGADISYGLVDGKGREARFQSIDGIAFGPDESLYVTDSACIRQIQRDGTVVLEIGFTLPNAWSGPRVRKITTAGEEIIATVGINDSSGVRAVVAQSVGISVERVLAFLYWNPGALFGMASLGA